MALFTQSSLGSDFDRPNGFLGDPVSANDPIMLPLSDGMVSPGLRHEEDGPVAPEADADDREDLERLHGWG